jgi:hypothetical protein
MKRALKARALRPLIEAALRSAQDASPVERADIFEGIALALSGVDPHKAKEAKDAAHAIRTAEQRQLLLFRNWQEVEQ